MDIAGLVKVKVIVDLDQLDRGLARGREKAGAFDKEASRAFRGVNAAAKDTGRSIKGMAAEAAVANDNFRLVGISSRFATAGLHELAAAGAILGAGALTSLSVQSIVEFKDAVAEVSTLVDTTSFDMDRLQASALKMANTFGGGATAQVKAFNDVISAGTEDLAKATTIVEAANKLAIGGATGVGVATDGLTSILNAYGDQVKNVSDISDAMFIAMRDGKTTVEELAGSLGRVAPIAAQTNVSFDELTAAIAALTLGGISTSEAVTGVRAMLAAIAKPSNEATKAAAQLGIEFNTTGLKAKGLVGFLDDLMKKTGGNTDALAILFGGVEALVPAMALAGTAGDNMANTMENMASKAGATQEAFDKMANSPGFQAGRMWSALQAEIIGAGGALDALVPLMAAVADNMHLIVTAATIFTAGHLVAALATVVTRVVLLEGAMTAAAVAARALSLAMAFFGGPIGIAVTALAGAYLLLRDNVSAAEQAALEGERAYQINGKALNDSKAASEGYTMALRNQIAMQVEAALATAELAKAEFNAALDRANAFESTFGFDFVPFLYQMKVAEKAAETADGAYDRVVQQLKRVDGNLKKTSEVSGDAASSFAGLAGKADNSAEKLAKAYDRIKLSAEDFIAQQRIEAQSIGLTEEATNRLRYEQDLLNDAKRAGINLTPKQTEELKNLAAEMASTEAQSRSLRDAFDFMKDTTQGFFSDMANGLRNGKNLWQSLGDAAVNAIGKIADKMIESGVNSLFGGGGGGGFGGGGIGSLIGSLFGLGGLTWDAWAKGGAFDKGNVVPFAKGATFTNSVVDRPTMFPMADGKTGVMGEAGTEGILPLRRNSAGQLGVISSGGAANNNQPQMVEMNLHVSVDGVGDKDLLAKVKAGTEEVVGKAITTFAGSRAFAKSVADSFATIKVNGMGK